MHCMNCTISVIKKDKKKCKDNYSNQKKIYELFNLTLFVQLIFVGK